MWSRTEGWADASAAVAVVLERTVEDRDPAADVGGWFCFCSAAFLALLLLPKREESKKADVDALPPLLSFIQSRSRV